MAEIHRSDAELIRGSLDDPFLFGEIFSRHYSAVFGFAARRLGVGEAGDVAGEVFVRAFRIRRRFDTSRSDCRPWLYGIAANIVGDRIRRTRRARRRFVVVDPALDVFYGVEDSDDRLVAESVSDRLNEALGELSAADRDTFVLYSLERLSYAEIAEVLDVPAGTVGSRIARARRRLRELIPDLEQITDRMDSPGRAEGTDDG